MASLKEIVLVMFLVVFVLPASYSRKLSKSVYLSQGAVNSVLIHRKGEKLAVYGDPSKKISQAELVLFTHFRRDVIWEGSYLVKNGTLAVAPAREKKYFTKGDSIWSEFVRTRFHNYNCQTTKIDIPRSEACRFVSGGEIMKWQDLNINVLNTPGYTRGSVSYIADIDGKRYAFTGDLIFGDGKILDLYSFQDSLSRIGGYHGYAVRLGQLVSSLQLIAGQKPDLIIPSRGPVIRDPAASIKKLIERIRSVYSNYLALSAYRWYYPDRMKVLSEHVLGPSALVDWMPFSSVIENNLPSWYVHINNSNLVIAEDSTAFLIDCGSRAALERILELKKTGKIKSVDGLFITHYHDDHTDLVNNVVKEFGCPVYATEELKDILQHPEAYNLPCLTNKPIPDLTIMKDGQKMDWKNYSLTFRYFPGQTLYHDALLFENNNGESVFFIGDSFTPSGIDDYCLLNRNLLHSGWGYFYCLDILKSLPGNVLLANQHVAPLFSFSVQQLDIMTNKLIERNSIFMDLFPWDDINYGVDEQWVRLYPYGQNATPGQVIDCTVKILNHSKISKTYFLSLNLPDGFYAEQKITTLVVDPLKGGEGKFKIKIPEHVSPGVSLITLNVRFDNWDLHEWCETIVDISH